MEKDRGMEGNRGQGADAVSNHDERKGESGNKTTRGTFRKRNHILNPEPYSPHRMSVYQRNEVDKNQAGEIRRREKAMKPEGSITEISNSGGSPPGPLYL